MVSDIERMNRKLRRKRIRKIVGFIFAVIVAVPVTIILMRTFLRTNSILIENGTQYSSASLLSSCSEYIGGTILDFESDTDKLFPPEEFPYIASAEVSVLLPDKMVVRLTRSVTTISVLTADGSYIYLDSDKKVLEISDRKGARLSVIPLGSRMNLILNPNPLWCADKNDLGEMGITHFMFTTESAAEAAAVIDAYARRLTPEQAGIPQIKRI